MSGGSRWTKAAQDLREDGPDEAGVRIPKGRKGQSVHIVSIWIEFKALFV